MIINPFIYSSAPSTDPDADAFILAAGITNATQMSAIDTLVTDLKGYSIWSKMKAIYPFVGGTASSHKFNLKTPLDTDAAFRLSFIGGLTHDSNGVQGNGTNGYYDTFLKLTDFPILSSASGVYIRTNIAETTIDYGTLADGGAGYSYLVSRTTGNETTFRYQQTLSSYGNIANTDSRGFHQLTRRDASNIIYSKNIVKSTVAIAAASSLPSSPIYGMAAWYESGAIPYLYSSRQSAFNYYADSSLSDTELDNLNTAVQAFQTTLSRNV